MLAALDSCVVWNGAGSKQLGAAAVGVKDTAAACQEFKFHSFHLGDGFVIAAVLSVMRPSGPILVSLCLSNSITILVKKWIGFWKKCNFPVLSEVIVYLIK